MNAGAGVQTSLKKRNANDMRRVKNGTLFSADVSVPLQLLPFAKKIRFTTLETNAGMCVLSKSWYIIAQLQYVHSV